MAKQPKNTEIGDFGFTYNGIVCGGEWIDGTFPGGSDLLFTMSWPDVDLATDTVYEESGRDSIGWDVTARIRCVLFRAGGAAQGDVYTQASEIHKRLLEPNGNITVAKGYGFEIGIADPETLNSRRVDLFGVRPIRCVVKPLPGVQGFYLEWTFRVRLHWYGPNALDNLGNNVPVIKGFSHSSAYQCDPAGVHQITSRMTVHVFARDEDRGLMTAEEAYWNILSGVRQTVPYGFFIASVNGESSPDKTTFVSTMILRQHQGERPPFGIVDSGGSFHMETSPGENLFREAIATLDRSYEVSKQAKFHTAPLAFITEVLHLQNTLVNQFAAIGKRYSIILAKMSILRGRGRDSRFWRCQASWVLTGCIGQLIFSEKTFETPKETANHTLAQDTTLDSFWLGSANFKYFDDRIRENVANDFSPIMSDDDDDKTISWKQDPPTISESAYTYLCNSNNVNPNFSWFYYNVKYAVLTRAQVADVKRMYPNPVTQQVQDDDNNASPSVVSVQPQPANQTNQPIPARALEDVSLADQLVQMTFVGIRLAHKPVAPQLVSIGGAPVYAIASYDPAAEKIGNIFGCPVFLKKTTVLYKAYNSITLLPYTEDITSCVSLPQ